MASMMHNADVPLLVPMRVDALLVNDQTRWGSAFHRWTATFHYLDENISPEPEAFTNNDAADWASDATAGGVYLQWQLPAALRHGVHDAASGQTDFPKIPNRWLVLRLAAGPPPSWRGWVVDSDYRHQGEEPGGSAYQDPSGNTPTGGRIGRSVPLERWTESREHERPWLNAVGPGLLTFSTYQPYNNDVLSLHDNLEGAKDTEDLSYLVVGWYANAGADILALTPGGAQALGWTVPDGSAPTRSLYVAHALNLPWDRWGPMPPSERPTDTGGIHVALGNSSVDALGGLLRAAGLAPADVGLLEALQHGLLDRLDEDGHQAMDRAVHASWFTTSSGGWHWQAVDKPDKPATRAQPTPAEQDAERGLLRRLNQAQADHDAQVRALADARWRVYAAWWLSRTPGLPAVCRNQFRAWLDGKGPLPKHVHNLEQDIKRRRTPGNVDSVPWGQTPEEVAKATAAYPKPGELTDRRMLRRAPLPEFRHPADPVVMLTGLKAPRPDDTGGALECRLPHQLVTTLGEPNSSMLPPLPPLPPLAKLPEPDVLAHTVKEFGLFALARRGGIDPTSAPVTGTRPPFGLTTWGQPWQPLYLEYELRHYPIPYQNSDQKLNWEFDGDRYRWKGTGAPDGQGYRTYRGRIFLTPHASFNLAGRLRQYARTHPNAPLNTLKELADKVSGWDLLSQSLDGLTQQIALRSPQLGPRPHKESPHQDSRRLATLIGDEHRAIPVPGPTPPADLDQAPPSQRDQMRAGQFHFTRLAIVDQFGQCCEVINPAGSGGATNARAKQLLLPPSLTPSATVSTISPHTYVELPPRLLQGARLRFEPLSSDGLDAGPYADPVCGWLLPNHLDNALAIYDRDGHALGEVRQVIGDSNHTQIGWDPAPDSRYPDIPSLTNKIPHLDTMLGALAAPPQPPKDLPDALTSLLGAVDETLFTVNPLGGFDDPTMTLLAGRPLAVLRARLWLELDGPALFDPSWRHWHDELKPRTDAPPPEPAFTRYQFGVRMGGLADQDDGLIGYYPNDNYSALYAVHTPAGAGPYVRAQAPLPLTVAGNPTQITLTLLTDPRAAIHAVTDLLPVATLRLDPELIEPRLRRLRLSFRLGPLLAGTTPITHPTDPKNHLLAAAIPHPATRHGDWKWTEPNGRDWTTLPLAPTGHPVITPPQARTGRLYRDAPLD